MRENFSSASDPPHPLLLTPHPRPRGMTLLFCVDGNHNVQIQHPPDPPHTTQSNSCVFFFLLTPLPQPFTPSPPGVCFHRTPSFLAQPLAAHSQTFDAVSCLQLLELPTCQRHRTLPPPSFSSFYFFFTLQLNYPAV